MYQKKINKDSSELPNEITSALEIVTISKLRDMFNKVFLEDITKRKDRIAKITCQMKNIKKDILNIKRQQKNNE